MKQMRMKILGTIVFAMSLAAFQAMAQDKPASSQPVSAAPQVKLSTDASHAIPASPAMPEAPDMKKVAYAIGMSWGTLLKQRAPDIDLNTIDSAIKDVLAGSKLQMTEEESQSVLRAFSSVLQAREMEKNRLAAEKNKVDGEAFLAKNAKEPGVVTLPSGLQYKVIAEGSGSSPKSNEVVTVNYRGALIDGTEFDSSYATNRKPFIGSVSGGVIKGWTEILQLMKAGSKYKVFVPSNLAYGPAGRRPKIEPNSVLIFDMELISFTEQKTPDAEGVVGDIIKVPGQDEMKKGAKVEFIKPGQTNAVPAK
jgi:FKBP-type peptidyl-prolyl cis-trans isomerase